MSQSGAGDAVPPWLVHYIPLLLFMPLCSGLLQVIHRLPMPNVGDELHHSGQPQARVYSLTSERIAERESRPSRKRVHSLS